MIIKKDTRKSITEAAKIGAIIFWMPILALFVLFIITMFL